MALSFPNIGVKHVIEGDTVLGYGLEVISSKVQVFRDLLTSNQEVSGVYLSIIKLGLREIPMGNFSISHFKQQK